LTGETLLELVLVSPSGRSHRLLAVRRVLVQAAETGEPDEDVLVLTHGQGGEGVLSDLGAEGGHAGAAGGGEEWLHPAREEVQELLVVTVNSDGGRPALFTGGRPPGVVRKAESGQAGRNNSTSSESTMVALAASLCAAQSGPP